MRISYISWMDLHGHKFNGMDLCQEIRHRGYDSRLFVILRQSNLSWVKSIGFNGFGTFILKAFHKIEYYTGLQNIMSPVKLFIKLNKYIENSDIVHLQMVQFSYFSLSMIKYLAKKKRVLWTMHDPWPLTGHCVHPITSQCTRWQIGCGKCPNLKATFAIPFDTTSLMHKIKKKIFNSIEIEIIVASNFMKNMIKESGMFTKSSITIIPFGVDKNVFFPQPKTNIRESYSIPKDNIVMMFRADVSEFKGTEILIEALRDIKQNNISLIIVNQEGMFNEFLDSWQVIDCGWIENDKKLSDLYSCADIFLMPSRAESFGMMAVEAMASGLPVVAFNNTALSDILNEGKAGILVDDGDRKSLTENISKLIESKELRNQFSNAGLQWVDDNYILENHYNALENLYKESK